MHVYNNGNYFLFSKSIIYNVYSKAQYATSHAQIVMHQFTYLRIVTIKTVCAEGQYIVCPPNVMLRNGVYIR